MEAFEELIRLLKEAGLTLTYDPKRNITLCASCGTKAPLGEAWPAPAPGFPPKDCRRLCDSCAIEAG